MFKLFYKTFLVSVLSGSLLLLDFSYKGMTFNSVYAESVTTEKIEDKNLMGTLTMTVVGVLGKRLYKYKPTTDIVLAAAGGAIFIGGEVLAFMKLKEVLKGMEVQITRDKNGNVNKEQIESIERLKTSYEEAKKIANVKKNLQMAAAAAFAAAGALAFKMTVTDLASLKSCNAGIVTGLKASTSVKATCKSLASNPSTASKGAKCFGELASCTSAVQGYKSSVMGYELGRQATGPSLPGLKSINVTESSLSSSLSGLSSTCKMYTASMASPVQTCKSLVPNNQKGESGGTGLVDPITSHNFYKDLPGIYKQEFLKQNISERQITNVIENKLMDHDNLFMKAIDLFFPKADAALFAVMGIASKAATAFILKTSATIGPAIDTFMLIPQKRAIVWGTLAGLTATATMSTNNVITQIDANIAKIDAILQSMYSMADGATGTQVAPLKVQENKVNTIAKPSTAPAAVQYEDVELSNVVKGTLPCATGPEDQKCVSFEESLKDLPSYQGLDYESRMQMDSIIGTANGLSGTSKITSGTLDAASKLAQNTSAIKSSMEKARSLAAKQLKDSGSSANLDTDSKKLSDQMEKAVRDNLRKSNMSASGMASSMAGGMGSGATSSGLAASATSTSDDIDAETAALLAKNRAAAEAAMAAGDTFNSTPGPSDSVNFGAINGQGGAGGEMTAEELAAYEQAAKNSAMSMDDYDLKNEDISKNADANIFELISNRYLQSGYPRLFRIKDPSVNEVAAPFNK